MAEDAGRESAEEKRYSVNFFKPTSAHSRSNAALVGTLVIIWAVAVFGFQFLLLAMQNPTAEPAYGKFQEVWGGVADGSASQQEMRDFGRVALAVLGKNVALKDGHREVVKNALNGVVVALGGAGATASVDAAASALALESQGFDLLYRQLLTTSLIDGASAGIAAKDAAEIPAIMELYLVHNRSALTDFTFLGFPFHYWYTAQFLLILFVVLCLVYAVLIDKIHKKHNFVEE